MELSADILAELTDDGDTVELADGHTLRLRVQADDMTAADDGDWYGEIAPVRWDRGYDREHDRPDGFNGNAEKLHFGGGDVVWWQPPADVKRGSPSFDSLRSALRDVLEFGAMWSSC